MDPEEFRTILSRSGVGIWSLIEAGIKVASSDYADELRRRRGKIVEALYAPPAQLCENCNGSVSNDVVQDEPYYPQTIDNTNNNNYNYSDNIDNDNYDNTNNDDKKLHSNRKDRDTNEDFSKSPLTPESSHRTFSGGEEEEDLDPFGGLFDDEQNKILSIKEQLEDPDQVYL